MWDIWQKDRNNRDAEQTKQVRKEFLVIFLSTMIWFIFKYNFQILSRDVWENTILYSLGIIIYYCFVKAAAEVF